MGTAHAVREGWIHLIVRSIVTLRLWKLLIAAAYPFFLFTATYCEALESTGTTGAFIADTMLPATLIAYVALILKLKKTRDLNVPVTPRKARRCGPAG
jgi:hypothetical protein